MAVTQAQLTQLYLAYFGRPPDYDGIQFYTNHPAFDIYAVAAGFSASPESQSLYGSGFGAAQVDAIYRNLFNRDAEPAGIAYWTNEVNAGRLTPAGAALAILQGAQNADRTAVDNKLAISAAFLGALDTQAELQGYAGATAATMARAFLGQVYASPESVMNAHSNLDRTIAAASGRGDMLLQLADASGTGDSIDLVLAAGGATDFRTIDAPGVEIIDIVSNATSAVTGTFNNLLGLSTTSPATLNISGNASLDLSRGGTLALLSIETVNAASFDAGLHLDLYGDTHDATILTGAGADILVSGFGSDTIRSGAGDDVIFAGRGADTLDAGAGNDWIRGGPLSDIMTGGAGVDVFAYALPYESQAGTGIDVITDFQGGAGGDVLDFSALHLSGSARTVFDTQAGILYLDADGNGTVDGMNDMAIHLAGVTGGLVAANFLF
jgi:Ca2+-binding RTX toxin-like protein